MHRLLSKDFSLEVMFYMLGLTKMIGAFCHKFFPLSFFSPKFFFSLAYTISSHFLDITLTCRPILSMMQLVGYTETSIWHSYPFSWRETQNDPYQSWVQWYNLYLDSVSSHWKSYDRGFYPQLLQAGLYLETLTISEFHTLDSKEIVKKKD